MDRLRLRVPAPDELGDRARWMSDPATMAYNRGYPPFEGYDPGTGCIAFPRDRWKDWYDGWVGCEPDRYYAYLVREKDGKVLGEINLHRQGEAWELGILLIAEERGKGYAREGMRLLTEQAFEKMALPVLVNHFELSRQAAVRLHLGAGFQLFPYDGEIMEFRMTRERYRELRDRSCRFRTAEGD